MDRNNKYYNLIEKLVKNHKKFPGYEAILEDIIDDVYAHSEVIINSIDNEDVIESYLEKVISTSIIIVPKKLKFNDRVSHRVISSAPLQSIESDVLVSSNQIDKKDYEAQKEQGEIPELSIDIPTEPIKELIKEAAQTNDNDVKSHTEQIVSEKANTKFVDQMINTMNSDLIVETGDVIPQLDEAVDSELSPALISEETEPEEQLPEEQFSEEVITADEDDIEPEFLLEGSERSEKEDETELLSDDRVEPLEEVNSLVTSDEVPILDIVTDEDSDKPVQSDISEELILEEAETEELQQIENSGPKDDLEAVLSDEREDNIIEEEQLDENSLSLDSDSEPQDEVNLLETVDEDVISTDSFEVEEAEKLQELNEQSENDNVVMLEELSDDNSGSILQEEDDDNLLLQEEVDNLTDNTDETNVENLVLSDNELLADSDVLVPVEEDDSDIDFILEDGSQSNNLDVIDEPSQEEVVTEALAIEEGAEQQVTFEDDYGEEDFLEPKYENNNKNIEYKALDYNIFSYNPNEIKNIVDTQQISENLINLNTKKPEYNVLEIFELRYKQNNSLEQISEKLNMSKEDIINVLNEIVELV